MVLLAKSNGTTLADHIRDVVHCVEVMKANNLQGISSQWWEDLLYAALSHDLGKIDPDIQDVLENPYPQKTFPHSLLSLLLFTSDHCHYPAEILGAVAFHHWRDYFPDFLLGLGSEEYKRKVVSVSASSAKWSQLLAELKNDLIKLLPDYDLSFIKLNEPLIDYLQWNTLADSGLLMPPYTLNFVPEYLSRTLKKEKERERVRVFMLGSLMRADHFASLIEDSCGLCCEQIELGKLPVYDQIRDAMTGHFQEFWQDSFFTANPEMHARNMVLVAGTGVGKTEFAYLWASGRKALMVLPLRVAVNKQWDRAVEFFRGLGSGIRPEIGLLHGNASIDLIERTEKTKGADSGNDFEGMRTLMLARHLASPLVISTADQIAPAALRYPGYERIFASLMGNCLIVDEIQAFDPKAAAIVTAMLEFNHFFGGKNLVMTATLPPFIRRSLQEAMDLPPEQIVDLFNDHMPELGSSTRHRINFSGHHEYEEILEAVVNDYQNGKRVLVVLNTVKKAQQFYDKLQSGIKADRLLLLHSRLTTVDRSTREDLLSSEYLPNRQSTAKSGCIVVATQVVEASLDINADILYSDPAPADSLVQRMGRVCRHLSRLAGKHAPHKPNVVIMIPLAATNKSNSTTTSIGSSPYDRDLVAVSLALLVSFGQGKYAFTNGYNEILANWPKCFRKKNKDKLDTPNQQLIDALLGVTTDLELSEKDKQLWVEQTFDTLTCYWDSPDLYLGRYLQDYEETLRIIRHGYCSNSRYEANRVFRQIADFEAIPEQFWPNFEKDVVEWVMANLDGGTLQGGYVDFAHSVLSRYVVNCPRNYFAESQPVDLSPEIEQLKMRDKDKRKVYRWVKGIMLTNLSYDQQKGLLLP